MKKLFILSCVIGLLSCEKEVIKSNPVVGSWVSGSVQQRSVLTFSENNYHNQTYTNSNIEIESMGTYVLKKTSQDYIIELLVNEVKYHNANKSEKPYVWEVFNATIYKDSISFQGQNESLSIKETIYRKFTAI